MDFPDQDGDAWFPAVPIDGSEFQASTGAGPATPGISPVSTSPTMRCCGRSVQRQRNKPTAHASDRLGSRSHT